MAERRCFSKKIVDSDAFLDMPITTQCLYFHLGMRADDDGFVSNPRRTARLIGTAEDDIKLLIAKRFLLPFENGVMVIKHWRMHNTLKNDRLKTPQYPEIAARLYIKENGSYTEDPQEGTISLLEHRTRAITARLPSGIQTEPQEKGREEKGREEKRREPNSKEVEGEAVASHGEPHSDGADSTEREERALKIIGGTIGQGVLFLTTEQMDDLLDRMSLTEFDWYTQKLAQFIIDHPEAKIKSHYKTILKWWNEDREVAQ